MQRSPAEGYQEASLSEQKVDGEDFIQTDVCPKAGDVILDLGCGTGELSAYLAELSQRRRWNAIVYRRDLMKLFGVLTPTAGGLCLKPFRSFSNGNGRLHAACLILPLSLKSD